LALQRIEAQTQLVLSRNIAIPNISSKGKLQPRTVSIPAFLAHQKISGSGSATTSASSESQNRPLIEEVGPSVPLSGTGSSAGVSQPKGILKNANPPDTPPGERENLAWSWSQDKDRLHIKISVPNLVRSICYHRC